MNNSSSNAHFFVSLVVIAPLSVLAGFAILLGM